MASTHSVLNQSTPFVDFNLYDTDPALKEALGHVGVRNADADPWAAPGPGAQVVRAAKYLQFSQVENGAQCRRALAA